MTACCCSALSTCPVFCGTWTKRPANEAVHYGVCFGRSRCGLMCAASVQNGTDGVCQNANQRFAPPNRGCRLFIADNLKKAGWSWGCVSAVDSEGQTIWIADAHRDDGKRFIVRADEKLTAFVELEAAIRVSEPIHIDIAGLGPETLRH